MPHEKDKVHRFELRYKPGEPCRHRIIRVEKGKDICLECKKVLEKE